MALLGGLKTKVRSLYIQGWSQITKFTIFRDGLKSQQSLCIQGRSQTTESYGVVSNHRITVCTGWSQITRLIIYVRIASNYGTTCVYKISQIIGSLCTGGGLKSQDDRI